MFVSDQDELTAIEALPREGLEAYLLARLQGRSGPPVDVARGERPHEFLRWAFRASTSGPFVGLFPSVVAHLLGSTQVLRSDPGAICWLLILVEELGLRQASDAVRELVLQHGLDEVPSVELDIHMQALSTAITLRLGRDVQVNAQLREDLGKPRYGFLAYSELAKESANEAATGYVRLLTAWADRPRSARVVSELYVQLLMSCDLWSGLLERVTTEVAAMGGSAKSLMSAVVERLEQAASVNAEFAERCATPAALAALRHAVAPSDRMISPIERRTAAVSERFEPAASIDAQFEDVLGGPAPLAAVRQAVAPEASARATAPRLSSSPSASEVRLLGRLPPEEARAWLEKLVELGPKLQERELSSFRAAVGDAMARSGLMQRVEHYVREGFDASPLTLDQALAAAATGAPILAKALRLRSTGWELQLVRLGSHSSYPPWVTSELREAVLARPSSSRPANADL